MLKTSRDAFRFGYTWKSFWGNHWDFKGSSPRHSKRPVERNTTRCGLPLWGPLALLNLACTTVPCTDRLALDGPSWDPFCIIDRCQEILKFWVLGLWLGFRGTGYYNISKYCLNTLFIKSMKAAGALVKPKDITINS